MKNFLMVFALMALAARAAAADKQEAPEVFAKLSPKVGAWAEYDLVGKKGDKIENKTALRMAVVGKESGAYWVEERMTRELPKLKKEHGPAYFKMLMGAEGAQKMYIKSDAGVMDMSGMMASASRNKKKDAIKKAGLKEAGEETIKVAAGEFKTTHYVFDNGKSSGDFWVKKGVGPYGLVKQIHRNSKVVMTMELTANGDGAKSEVDETTARSMPSMADALSRRRAAGAAPGGASGDEGSGSIPTPSMSNIFSNALKKKAHLGQ